jgi:hypothetical protein
VGIGGSRRGARHVARDSTFDPRCRRDQVAGPNPDRSPGRCRSGGCQTPDGGTGAGCPVHAEPGPADLEHAGAPGRRRACASASVVGDGRGLLLQRMLLLHPGGVLPVCFASSAGSRGVLVAPASQPDGHELSFWRADRSVSSRMDRLASDFRLSGDAQSDSCRLVVDGVGAALLAPRGATVQVPGVRSGSSSSPPACGQATRLDSLTRSPY